MSNCSAIDSTLAILSDQRNRGFISNWIKDSFAGSANLGEIWIGGTKSSNGWVWLDGTRMVLPGGSNPSADHGCASGIVGRSLTISTSDCASSLGFVCEKPANTSPCSTQRCQNGGTCQDVGCHYKCECRAGYEGFTCSDDLLTVTSRVNKITIEKNQRANVTLDITSRVGSLTVRISSILGETDVRDVQSGQHSFSVGPFTRIDWGTPVTFYLFPRSNAFLRSTTVNIVVLDPPHASISPEWAAIGYGDYIYCSATGTPKPTLSWYKAGKKVLESNDARKPHQFSSHESQVLCVNHSATSDAGIYSCRATNVINGEERVDEKQFYGTISPTIVDKNATTIDLGVIKISCLVESYPAPKISWTLERDATTATTINDTFGLFSLSDRALGNHRYEYVLSVSLSDWLGEARIRCTAETWFSSASEYLELNERMRGYDGIVYTFTNPYENMTRDQADVHCKRMHSEICKVNDVATQKILSESSETWQTSSSAHVGGRAHVLNGSRVWLWSDGDMIYNETKYGRWTGTIGRYLDDIYAGWSSGRPNDNGDCMMLARKGGRYWSNVPCETRLPAICQRRMQGAPVLHAKAGDCSSTILISWNASLKAVGMRHRIDVRPINNVAGKYPDPMDVVATTKQYAPSIENMSFSTTYEIRIYPCPKYCLKEAGIVRYVTTGADITTLTNQVNVSKITGAQACAISWTDNRLRKGITGYQITAVSSLAHAVSYKWLKFKERTEHDVEFAHGSTFTYIGKPNRNYTFFIRTKTCSGYGRPTYAEGSCIMERSAPSYVPALTQSSTGIATDGTMKMDLPNLDESNGPISCIFIIVDTTSDDESMRRRTFGREELHTASIVQLKSSKTVYISLALSTEAMHAIDKNDSANHALIIGDNDTSSCDASRISSVNSRRKRSFDMTNVYNGYNEPLDKSKSYGVYVVTATPMDDGSIAYKSSDPVRIGRVEQYNSSSKAWVAGLVVGLLTAVLLMLLALLIIRRKQVSRVKSVDKSIELQANSTGEGYSFNSTNQNVNKSIKVHRSDTDIPLSRLEETYKALAADGNAGFTNHYKKLKAASEGILFARKIASNPNIQNKNRYKDIIPFDKNVVRLTGDKNESYINASFIEGFGQGNKFISTQGPLRATVDDFWRLVTEQQCHTIVMLTKCVEKGEEKCAQYWPDQGNTQTYGRISVHNESETKECGYIVRLFKVARQGVMAITVHHFQFVHWPDEGVPIATTEFMGMQRVVSHRLEKLGSTVPTVVHCSDGAGRTGVFIAFDNLSEEKQKIGRVDVYTCVYNLLRQRVQMVQNRNQYVFIYKLLLECYLFGNTEIEIDNIQYTVREENFSKRISKEFLNLTRLAPLQCEIMDTERVSAEEVDESRPYMYIRTNSRQLPDEEDLTFFNNTRIPTSDDTVRMTVAQAPTGNSIATFWSMVFEKDITIVVMLANCNDDNEEPTVSYWPNEVGSEMDLDCLTVKMTKVQTLNEKIRCREFHLTKGLTKKNVIQYQLNELQSDTYPPKHTFVLDLITMVKSKLRRTKSPSILIHCTDGGGRTGTFCAIWNLLDSVGRQNAVDVFRVVKDLRDFHCGMTFTEEEYKFCYEAMSEYATSTAYSVYDISHRNDEASAYSVYDISHRNNEATAYSVCDISHRNNEGVYSNV